MQNKTKDSSSMAEVLVSVCNDLRHEEGATPCIKMFTKHLVHQFHDLNHVPRIQLEQWGLPLKLIDALYVLVAETETADAVRSMHAYMNYTIRPGFQWIASVNVFEGLHEKILRHRDPEKLKEWAALRIQRNYRAYKKHVSTQRQLVLEHAFANMLVDSDGEMLVPTAEQTQQQREQRAMKTLSKAVRRLRERRSAKSCDIMEGAKASAKGRHERYSNMCQIGPGSLVAGASGRACCGFVSTCEVTRFMRRKSREAGLDWDVVKLHLHNIVTFNWIEKISDLALIEDRHWGSWTDIPENVQSILKQEVTQRSRSVLKGHMSTCIPGAAAAYIFGDFATNARDWTLACFRTHSEDDENDRIREHEIRSVAAELRSREEVRNSAIRHASGAPQSPGDSS